MLVSLTIWIVAQFSPNEWHPPQPCTKCMQEEEEQQQLTMHQPTTTLIEDIDTENEPNKSSPEEIDEIFRKCSIPKVREPVIFRKCSVPMILERNNSLASVRPVLRCRRPRSDSTPILLFNNNSKLRSFSIDQRPLSARSQAPSLNSDSLTRRSDVNWKRVIQRQRRPSRLDLSQESGGGHRPIMHHNHVISNNRALTHSSACRGDGPSSSSTQFDDYGYDDEHFNLINYGDQLAWLENGFTLGNSFWFAIGTLMQQGSDLNPQVKFET